MPGTPIFIELLEQGELNEGYIPTYFSQEPGYITRSLSKKELIDSMNMILKLFTSRNLYPIILTIIKKTMGLKLYYQLKILIKK